MVVETFRIVVGDDSITPDEAKKILAKIDSVPIEIIEAYQFKGAVACVYMAEMKDILGGQVENRLKASGCYTAVVPTDQYYLKTSELSPRPDDLVVFSYDPVSTIAEETFEIVGAQPDAPDNAPS